MELIFLRHGEPAWNVDGISQIDPNLTPLGIAQAEAAAVRLSTGTRPVAEILVSPAARARQTAQPLIEATAIDPRIVDDLVEIGMPDWSGRLELEVQRIFAASRSRSPDEWWDGLPEGESFRDFHRRITEAMARLLAERGVVPDRSGHRHLWHAEADPGRIVVVAHGGTNAVALGWLLGVEPTPWEWERFVLGHASIARVRAVPLAGGHVFSLRSFNDQQHIEPDRRTR